MKGKTKKLILSVISMLYLTGISAQIQFEKRIELELKNGYENEVIHKSLLGYFVMESTADEEINNQVEVKYDLFDSNLELIKTASIQIPSKMRFAETYANDDNIYNIYKNKKGDFIITKIQIKDLNITKTTGIIPPKTQFQDMKILGSSAWFYAVIKNEPFIYRIDLESGKGKVIPVMSGSFSPKKIKMENYQLLEKSNELQIYLSKKIQKGVYKMDVIRVKENGELDKTFTLSDKNASIISSVSGNRLSENRIIYTGTYSKKVLGQSEGLFFCESVDDKTNYINYYNFLDLKDFLSYLPEKKQEKIEKKKKRKEDQGKQFSINYSIASHDIIELPDGYLFLGEAYYPTYRTEQYMTTQTVNGITSTVMHYRTIFDGYQYTHAILTKFSKQGELLWDVCFEMFPNNKPFQVKEFIDISEQTENSICMVFSTRNNVVSKIVDFNGNVLSDNKWDIIETGKETDKTRWTVSSSDYWFDNYFLVYGSQKIKDQQDKSKRKVFFVNKVGF
jgi:hypothetical protein